MANTNFKTWLGSDKLSGNNTQQNTYNGLINGFPVGGQIKAGDFNAALRMTTLVCAGIAAACGFDNLKTIDAAEDEIKNAIVTKLVTPYSNLLAVLNSGGNDYQVAYAAESGTANKADEATTAISATQDGDKNVITSTYGKFVGRFTDVPKANNQYELPGTGTYHIRIVDRYGSGASDLRRVDFGIVYWAKNEIIQSPCFNTNDESIYSFKIDSNGIITAYRGKNALSVKVNEAQVAYVVIYYKKIL